MKESSPVCSEEAQARKRRAQAAAHRRHKLMAQMSRQMDKFAMENAEDLEAVSLATPSTSGSAEIGATSGFFSDQIKRPVAAGVNRTLPENVDITK